MVTEIKKGASKKTIEQLLKKANQQPVTENPLDAFFGRLPHIEDGLKFQKKVRREWK